MTISVHEDVRLGPWRGLPPEWVSLRESLVGAPIGDESACALEALVLCWSHEEQRSKDWSVLTAPDLLASLRIQRLLESFAGVTCRLERESVSGAHPHIRYELRLDQGLPLRAIQVLEREQRRLAAGERWLTGARDLESTLAAALWRATILKSPPMRPQQPGLSTWRVHTRPEAYALAAAAFRLSQQRVLLQSKFHMWRVPVAIDQLAPALLMQ